MQLLKIVSGKMGNNTYIIADEGAKTAVIIDPAWNNKELEQFVQKMSGELEFSHIVLTHGHYDHVRDTGKIKSLTGAAVAIHPGDAALLESETANMPFPAAADILLSDRGVIRIGGLGLSVLHTPGHTPGGVCLALEDYLFTGDTLFYGTVGRTDLAGGDKGQLEASLKKLAGLERDYILLPGHDRSSRLSYEKQHNGYMLSCI